MGWPCWPNKLCLHPGDQNHGWKNRARWISSWLYHEHMLMKPSLSSPLRRVMYGKSPNLQTFNAIFMTAIITKMLQSLRKFRSLSERFRLSSQHSPPIKRPFWANQKKRIISSSLPGPWIGIQVYPKICGKKEHVDPNCRSLTKNAAENCKLFPLLGFGTSNFQYKTGRILQFLPLHPVSTKTHTPGFVDSQIGDPCQKKEAGPSGCQLNWKACWIDTLQCNHVWRPLGSPDR